MEVKKFMKGIVVFEATMTYICREVWEVGVGEALVHKGEPKSASDRYAVAMKKEGAFTGHLLEAVATCVC